MAQLLYPLFRPPNLAGIQFDHASNSGYEATLSTYNWTHTCSNANNRVLIVGVSIFATGTVTSITYNGVSMSFVRSDTNGVYRSEIWKLVAPDSGANTVTVNLSASLTSIAQASSYEGVDQTNPIDANNGANGTGDPASGSVTTIIASDWVVDNLSTIATSVTAASTQRTRTNANGALGTGGQSDRGPIVTPASTAMQWNGLSIGQSWALSMVALKPVQSVARRISDFFHFFG